MLVGLGYDIHCLVKGRKLFLGGVKIPFKKGLDGHSDADVILHALCDAMLGAAGERDIGYHFPNTSQKYKNISSLLLLGKVNDLLEQKNFRVNNLDIVLIAEEPKIGKYVDQMKEIIGEALNVSKARIGVKATTNEGVGLIGQGEAIAAFCLVSIIKK